MGRVRRNRCRLNGPAPVPQPGPPGAENSPTAPSAAQIVQCGSCAARMQMAVQDWWCPVCGWWWAITQTHDGIKATGCRPGSDRLTPLDITCWTAAADPADPKR